MNNLKRSLYADFPLGAIFTISADIHRDMIEPIEEMSILMQKEDIMRNRCLNMWSKHDDFHTFIQLPRQGIYTRHGKNDPVNEGIFGNDFDFGLESIQNGIEYYLAKKSSGKGNEQWVQHTLQSSCFLHQILGFPNNIKGLLDS